MDLIKKLGRDLKKCLDTTETLMIIKGGVFDDLYDEAFSLMAQYDEYMLAPYPVYDTYRMLRNNVTDLMSRIGDNVYDVCKIEWNV